MTKPFATQARTGLHTSSEPGLEVNAQREHFRLQTRLLDAIEQAVMATDLDGVVIYWNRFAQHLYGWTVQEAIGRNILDLIVAPEAPRGEIITHLRRGESWSAEIEVHHKNGTTFPVQVTRSPVYDDSGQLIGIVGVSSDITHRRRTEAALGRSEEHLRVAQQAGGIGTFEWNMRTGEVTASAEFCRLWGMPPHRSLRVGIFSDLVHPTDRERLAGDPLRPVQEDLGYTEFRIRRFDTREERWLARRGEIIRDKAGASIRVVGVAYDITDRKHAEERLRLVMGEMAHRVKNTLAIVQAMASQTMRSATSLDEAQGVLTARLANLGAAHDALIQENWSGAGIHAVVQRAVQPHAHRGRVSWNGSEVNLGPQAALALSLALHELATNATKYGALSVEEGSVAITWGVSAGSEGPLLSFRWQEHGGPPVKPPTRRGFGSRLIKRGLIGSFGNGVDVTYAPEGVVLTILAPLMTVQGDAGAPAGGHHQDQGGEKAPSSVIPLERR